MKKIVTGEYIEFTAETKEESDKIMKFVEQHNDLVESNIDDKYEGITMVEIHQEAEETFNNC